MRLVCDRKWACCTDRRWQRFISANLSSRFVAILISRRGNAPESLMSAPRGRHAMIQLPPMQCCFHSRSVWAF
eukprot:2661628-Pyramimonas_sp.AAC.1